MVQHNNPLFEFDTKLHDELIQFFNEEELRTLCFEINVDYENLPGAGKTAKVRELIGYLNRRSQISVLTNKCAEKRPNPSHIWNNSNFESFINSQELEPRSPHVGSLYEHISVSKPISENFRTNWDYLEHILVEAVINGGVAGMTHYRRRPDDLPQFTQGGTGKNPSTWADLLATARILETLNSTLPAITRPYKLDCMLSYLGEETRFIDWFEKHGVKNIPERVLSDKDFFSPRREHNRLRVIVDGIDGTGSFIRGIPIFCSAAAILVEDEPRISAVYDPIHHVAYSALLLGPHGKADERTKAQAWEVSTGNRTDLVKLMHIRNEERTEGQLKKEALGIHLTRSNQQKLHEFLRGTTNYPQSMLERLAGASGAIYSLNCGIFAMVEVATGSLAGFVNNVTNLWDIAAGEVLVRACGGKVATFEGKPIDYSMNHQPSVVAANKLFYPAIINILQQD